MAEAKRKAPVRRASPWVLIYRMNDAGDDIVVENLTKNPMAAVRAVQADASIKVAEVFSDKSKDSGEDDE